MMYLDHPSSNNANNLGAFTLSPDLYSTSNVVRLLRHESTATSALHPVSLSYAPHLRPAQH